MPKREDPIGEDELLAALEKAGYALEVEIAEVFRSARMHASNGARVLIGGEQWKDLDVRAIAPYKAIDGQLRVNGRVFTLAQVKRLHAPSWFVGILGHRPPDDANAFSRGKVSGLPSFGCGPDEHDGLFSEEGGLVHAFEGFLRLPVCVHWAVAARNDKGNVKAEAPFPFYEDLRTLALGRDIAERRASLQMRRSSSPPLLITILLTLVVDTPALYVLDPFTKQLRKEGMLSVLQAFDGGEEGPVVATIDVITAAECPKYAVMVGEVRDRLREYAATRVELMTTVTAHAREQQRTRDVEQAFEDYDTRNGVLGGGE